LWTPASQRARYCSASCRTLASRARRQASIHALAGYLDVSADVSEQAVHERGAAYAGHLLSAAGFTYDERRRTWVLPFELDFAIALPALLAASATRCEAKSVMPIAAR
jgi:hypothetical protein